MDIYEKEKFDNIIKKNTDVMKSIVECSLEEEMQNFLAFDFIISNGQIIEYLIDELKDIFDKDKANKIDTSILAIYLVGDKPLVINIADLLWWCCQNKISYNIDPNYYKNPKRMVIEFEKISVLKQEMK